jgi:hypothetical protein
MLPIRERPADDGMSDQAEPSGEEDIEAVQLGQVELTLFPALVEVVALR